MTAQMTVQFPGGVATAPLGTFVTVGDRLVPPSISVQFPSADGQPELRLELAVENGIPQCREIRICSVPGGREVRPLDLDAVKLRQWTDDVFAAFAVIVTDSGTAVPASDDAEQLATLQTFQRERRGKGARRITPQLLELAAEIYRAHIDDRPIQAVADAFGVSERAASGYITKARDPQYGFLPPTTRGKKQA